MTKEYEGDDPMELVGAVISGGGDDQIVKMATVFMEEFLRMGWRKDDILATFADPFYRGPHRAYNVLGEEKIRSLMDEARVKTKRGGE